LRGEDVLALFQVPEARGPLSTPLAPVPLVAVDSVSLLWPLAVGVPCLLLRWATLSKAFFKDDIVAVVLSDGQMKLELQS
jgi:hypothetical protein